MVSSLIPTVTILILLGAITLVFIMFLPAILELKKPKDAGPRIIMDDALEMRSQLGAAILIADIENGEKIDQALAEKIATIIAVLPSLEV